MRFTRSGQKWSSDVLRRRPEERDVAVQRRIDENVVQSVRAIPANLEQDERRMSQAEVPIYHFLANIPLLRNATPESIERVAEGTRRVFANKGETLFRRGDPCKGFWIVLYGQVKLFVESPTGQEKVIELMGPGKSFAEAIMFMDIPYAVSAQTLADSLLLHVSKDTVNEELAHNPAFARRMIAGLSIRLHGLIHDVESYSMRSGTERFVGYLLRLGGDDLQSEDSVSDVCAETVKPRIRLPATKATIASRLNLTPEHFSHVIHDLAARGLIEIEGREIVIVDMERLRRYPE